MSAGTAGTLEPSVTRPSPATEPGAISRRRAIIAAAAGNFAEWYDFVIFGTFAAAISAAFFPGTDPTADLLRTFAIYGVAFVGRPAGAMIFGHFGDRFGRKNALAASLMLMLVSTLAIGVAPTYASIGVGAAFILFAARLLQGVSCGGEFGGGTSYIVELAPPNRRGLYGSVQTFTVGLGLAVGLAIGLILANSLSTEAFGDWGWRIPFLIGAPLALVGLYIRYGLQESEKFTERADAGEVARSPLKVAFTEHWRPILLAIALTVVWTVGAYTYLVYLPTFLIVVVEKSYEFALGASLLGVLLYMALIPTFGALSDRVGRRPLMLVGAAGILVTAYPAFLLFETGDFGLIMVGQLLVLPFFALFAAPSPTVLTELFSTDVRYSAVGIGFASSVALFGGTAPFIHTWIIDLTGSSLAPAFYVMLAAPPSFIAVWLFQRETAFEPLPD